jgi:hypothetical protein
MCNVTIAKTKLEKLTSRTQKDLYLLKYESIGFTPINEETLYTIREILKENNMPCPLYKWSGVVKFKKDMKEFYNVLNILASEYSIVFDPKTFDN